MIRCRGRRSMRSPAASFAAAALAVSAPIAHGQEAPKGDIQTQTFAVHGQMTFVDQAHDSFRSPYEGANSL
jgi:hypothetical protein